MTTFTLSSPDIPTGGTIAPVFESDMFGCGGSNQSPVLQWSGAPAGTQSFAVTVYDPDAPTGSGWWHWMVVDLPASVTALPANAGEKGGANLPAARARCATTTASGPGAACAHRPATNRTATFSRCMRCPWLSWTCRTTPPRPSAAS